MAEREDEFEYVRKFADEARAIVDDDIQFERLMRLLDAAFWDGHIDGLKDSALDR